MTEADIPQTSPKKESEELFINDNLLIRPSAESLSATITKTWMSLNEQDKSDKNNARKSITRLIQTLCRKAVLPGHDCWTSNPHAVPYFIHNILNKRQIETQNKPKPWKRKLEQYLKNDFGDIQSNDESPNENFLSLNKKQYLSFNYAVLNLPTDHNDLHEVIYKHISFHEANKSDVDSRQYLEEVYKHKDKYNLPISLIEQILRVVPNIVEIQLIDFATKVQEVHQNIDENNGCSEIVYPDIDTIMDIVMLCSKSKICFQMCIEILNTLFIRTDCSEVVYKFIQVFMKKLQELIDMPKFILLYPEEYHIIIHRMQMTINSINTKILLELCKKLVQCGKGKKVFMLLTHNPSWFQVLKNDIVPAINIS